mgnify:CR=1 FL=1
MADATYNPGGTGVRRDQGGRTITLGSTAAIVIEDGGKINDPVVAGTTTTAITNYGITTVTKGTTATGVNNYTISDPEAGVRKWISCTIANVSEFVTITAATNVTFSPGNTMNKLKIVAAGGIALAGIDSTTWSTIGVSTTVAFPTS